MLFKNVLGQETVKSKLIQLKKLDRIPHALLFLGPTGCGKLALAIALVQYILCENKTATDSCGICRNCQKVTKLLHPDVHFSYPFIGANNTSLDFLPQWRAALSENAYLSINDWLQQIGAENKQGNINKEECLRIIKQLSLKPYESEYKFLILWMPEYLQKEGNRLLKLIEEPPENTIFILVAENSERILNTILSRCQIVKINALSDEHIINGLMERMQLSEEQATSIAHLADGNFNEAITLTKNLEDDNATLFLEWLRKCYIGNGLELVSWVDKFANLGREQQKFFFKYGLHFMREFLIYQTNRNQSIRLRPQELKVVQNLSKVLTFQKIEPITTLLNDCFYYIERNANAKIIGLDASIQMHRIFIL